MSEHQPVLPLSNQAKIKALQEQIENLKKQWPAHSTPPAMMQRLDDLEEELERELKQAGQTG